MFGSLLELKNANFDILLKPKIGNQGQLLMSEAMFYGICFTERRTYIQSLSYVFYCNLIYNKCTHVSNNQNIQFFKIKFQNSFRPIASNVFQIIVLLPILHPFFLYKQ